VPFKPNEKELLTIASQSPRHVEAKIVNHIKRLSDEGLKHGSIKTNCYSIFHFFEMNDVILNKRKIIRFLPLNEGTREDRAYTHQEIHDILAQTDERTRVIILLMASAGMRIGAALSYIQVGDLTKIEEYNLYRSKVYANSPKDRYYTFCTPECAAAIDSYLEYRQRFGETPIKSQAPLIREQFNTRLRDPFRIANPKMLTENAITTEIKTILKHSGGREKNVKQSHGFRKFAVKRMIKANVDYSTREYLVGHRFSRGLDYNYDRTTEEDRMQEHLKAVDLHTINSE
jgi:integrase